MDNEILEQVRQIVRFAKGGHLLRTVELANHLEAVVKKQDHLREAVAVIKPEFMKPVDAK